MLGIRIDDKSSGPRPRLAAAFFDEIERKFVAAQRKRAGSSREHRRTPWTKCRAPLLVRSSNGGRGLAGCPALPSWYRPRQIGEFQADIKGGEHAERANACR